ncbi:MAG: hypothetical protein BRD21_07705 [Halobacteriales archaeon SW_8_66_22]|nr:MAG: hypothetical protein BRD21_07705 [Halobacteriales archaeon SW_8_66_22]
MSDWSERISFLRSAVDTDLLAVLAFLLLTDISLLAPVIRETPLRIVTGFVVLLFLPGYALVSLMFPEAGRGLTDKETTGVDDSRRGIDGLERLIFSIALSLVIVMAVALGLHTAGIPIRLESTLLALNVLTVVITAGAIIRRNRIPKADRFQPALTDIGAELKAEIQMLDRVDRVLSVVFVVLLVFVAAGTAYTVAVPSEDEKHTELYLLTEDRDGNLTATDYPTNFTVGEGQSFTVGVTNHEFETVNYTVVVVLQNVTRRSASTSVRSERELHRFSTSLEHEGVWRKQHTIVPRQAGTNLRLQYLLYRGAPPEQPSRQNAYRHVHLWINATG